jgi:hypothetical protein
MHTIKQAQHLEPGDLVDLEDDPFADPNRLRPLYQFQYATVYGAERETPDCVRVDFDAGSVGFPPTHRCIVVV